jgi:hypothetical protein
MHSNDDTLILAVCALVMLITGVNLFKAVVLLTNTGSIATCPVRQDKPASRTRPVAACREAP